MTSITPFLWFDTKAEEAAEFYVSIFPDSRITRVARYGEAGPGPAGSAMTVDFSLRGQGFVALNGGPVFSFTPAVSFVVDCEDQAEGRPLLVPAVGRRVGGPMRLAHG